MSTTLTNGLKLPDKGSVDWYADMQNNYTILDGAVGTVADHTTQIAGKAPAVHTHTKSDITDFPAYGTTAGTICEGNDSRLSDARTPIAHTHGNISNDGKLTNGNRAVITGSDKAITESSVTDTELGYLSGVTSAIQTQLNGKANDSSVVHNTGNEGISGTKTFKDSSNVDVNIQKGVSSGSCNIRFNDDTGLSRTVIRSYNDQLEIGHLRNANWDDGAEIILKDNGSSKIKSNDGTVSTEVSFNPDSVKPTNSAIDLGTSSNKWKSVYSDSYYYGTTAWGLDKANVWSQNQTISASTNKAYIIANTSYTLGEATPSSTKELGGVFFKDSNSNNAAYLNVGHEKTTGDVYTRILTRFKFDNGVKSTTGSAVNTALDIGLTNSAEKFVRPSVNGEVTLGTSTNKWKTLNGVNPGALSLPKLSSASITLDISAQGLNWDLTGATAITYTPPFDGWLQLKCEDVDGDFLFAYWQNFRQSVFGKGILSNLSYGLAMTIPVRKDVNVILFCKASSNASAIITPCLGNV